MAPNVSGVSPFLQGYLRHGCCAVQCLGPAAALCLLRSLAGAVSLRTGWELPLWYRHVSLSRAWQMVINGPAAG